MTNPQVERLRELLARATPGPWVYRPQERDDWGFIRTTADLGGWNPVVAVSRGDTEHGLHRARGTDPYEPNGRLIVEAVNTLPSLLAERDALLAEREGLRARVLRLEEALRTTDDALCEYACHGGPEAPCIRPPEQCRSECGKSAGDALVATRAALTKDQNHD